MDANQVQINQIVAIKIISFWTWKERKTKNNIDNNNKHAYIKHFNWFFSRYSWNRSDWCITYICIRLTDFITFLNWFYRVLFSCFRKMLVFVLKSIPCMMCVYEFWEWVWIWWTILFTNKCMRVRNVNEWDARVGGWRECTKLSMQFNYLRLQLNFNHN